MGMLEGRVAICTGAARGVGAEVAKLMAKEGARIVVVDPLHTETVDKADVPQQVKDAAHRQALFDEARVALAG